ncbi:DNA-binding response OmpR family regulator [Jatrophihabitans sp. GAS493]|uniref:response regulator transcription factor n=1 Tax=Jatrophihabitans sp. GAS493 TaxID=1907575 RepID=UPI000BC07192|nr:response regulator transcription factor [Jatrophihabitans sp. GAS493]SOD73289.1 DNA-binding response OmpR family regulator [Jatrophihabitans sp. GAS493]
MTLSGEPAHRGLVVVAEDDASIADILRLYLVKAGYRVQVERDGAAALAAIRSLKPAAVVLDVGLPSMDGIEVCRRLRAEQNWTVLLFVTARDEEIDRVLGLELGADDYIVKPFSPREVVARVNSALRRAAGASSVSSSLTVGAVRLEPGARRVYVGDSEVSLTATEFDLLAFLMRSPGQVFDRDQLLSHVWGYSAGAGTRTVDVHIAQLRSKLGALSPVRTVRGVGYSAEAPH